MLKDFIKSMQIIKDQFELKIVEVITSFEVKVTLEVIIIIMVIHFLLNYCLLLHQVKEIHHHQVMGNLHLRQVVENHHLNYHHHLVKVITELVN